MWELDWTIGPRAHDNFRIIRCISTVPDNFGIIETAVLISGDFGIIRIALLVSGYFRSVNMVSPLASMHYRLSSWIRTRPCAWVDDPAASRPSILVGILWLCTAPSQALTSDGLSGSLMWSIEMVRQNIIDCFSLPADPVLQRTRSTVSTKPPAVTFSASLPPHGDQLPSTISDSLLDLVVAVNISLGDVSDLIQSKVLLVDYVAGVHFEVFQAVPDIESEISNLGVRRSRFSVLMHSFRISHGSLGLLEDLHEPANNIASAKHSQRRPNTSANGHHDTDTARLRLAMAMVCVPTALAFICAERSIHSFYFVPCFPAGIVHLDAAVHVWNALQDDGLKV